MIKSKISNISYYLPSQVLTNEDLVTLFPEKKGELIFKSFGIKKRHIRKPKQTGSDLSFLAANQLFSEFKEIEKDKIDFLIFCTEGLDYKAPTSASVLHYRLGLNQNCGCIDMPMGCAGYVYGLSLANAMIVSGNANNVLLLVSDIPSSVIHSQDFDLRCIFGDAGAATLIQATEKNGIGKFVFGNDGEGAKNLIVERGSTRAPIDSDWIEIYKEEDEYLAHGKMEMNGLEIARFSLQRVPTLIEETLAKNNLNFDEIDLFVFHQASKFILSALQRKCKIPKEKFYEYYENVGNTVSCTIPIALKHALLEGKLKKGYKVMLLGFGVGYSWGGTIIEWD
ncbi:MAG: ketoacyl-ACP synthase III [Flavobacteriales bacterium]|nr:ketoacyl-ACP synthase III [Flavobacteriales bacterium]